MAIASIAPFTIEALEGEPASICTVDHELRVTYVNRAWLDFGRDNGARWGEGRWTIGVALLDAVPPILHGFYEELFERARATRTVVEHSYECSSPTTFRHFHMRIHPCEGALVVVHSLSQESPHDLAAGPAIDALYRDASAVLLQCSHCRRVARAERGAAPWDWVPEYAARPQPNTSHGLCPLCERFYFPE